MLQSTASPTLDGLFRRILARQPDAVALVDPPDKMRVSGTPPLRLTFAQADRAISALAAHFVEAGLPSRAIVAVQLPNTVEFALTVLAAHRAGLIVALLPQLWRHADLTVALNRIGARAIVGCSRIDGVNHADLTMNAAVEAFSIRHVCGFGPDLPDGMIALDDLLLADRDVPAPAAAPDARHAALISFDVTASGLLAVPRTHLNLISGGLAIFLESGMGHGGTLLATQSMGSFAGIASSLVCWLLSGGTLALHHPFDGDSLERQLIEENCDTLIAPAALAMRLGEDHGLLSASALRDVVALWRTPEHVASSPSWPSRRVGMTDVYLFGEAGLFGARRGDDGAAAAVMPGPYGAPRSDPQSPVAGETLLTEAGTLALRGSMVPALAYAADAGEAHTDATPITFVDTGYAARLDRTSGAICITAPPPGLMTVGGYRFRADYLQAWAARLGDNTMLTALPDRVSGHRLAGRAADNARARAALAELGLSPLMAEAFRDRISQS